jgi:hypothetical protein
VPMMPAPMAVVPMPVPVMAPAHLLRPEPADFVRRRHCRTNIRARGRRPLFDQWRGRHRCSFCAANERGRSCRDAQSETQCQIEKASAFHLLSFRIEQANRDWDFAPDDLNAC